MQKEKAARLVATAKRMAVEATRCSKRRRVVQKPAERLHSPDHILLGARVAVYWPDDKQFYNVSQITYLPFNSKHTPRIHFSWKVSFLAIFISSLEEFTHLNGIRRHVST